MEVLHIVIGRLELRMGQACLSRYGNLTPDASQLGSVENVLFQTWATGTDDCSCPRGSS